MIALKPDDECARFVCDDVVSGDLFCRYSKNRQKLKDVLYRRQTPIMNKRKHLYKMDVTDFASGSHLHRNAFPLDSYTYNTLHGVLLGSLGGHVLDNTVCAMCCILSIPNRTVGFCLVRT